MGPMGAAMVDGSLQQPIAGTPLTGLKVLELLQGKMSGYAIVDQEALMLGQPAWQGRVEIEGAGELAKIGATLIAAELATDDVPSGYAYVDMSPMTGAEGNPLLLASTPSGSLVITSSTDSISGELKGGALADDEAFKKAIEGLPTEGYAFVYTSESMNTMRSDQFAMITAMQPQLAPVLEQVQGLAESWAGPYVSVGVLKDTGMLGIERSALSPKIAMAAVPAVAVGLGAAMAIPAFNKVRETSREKAITNNLRMVASAGMQYMLEEGKASAKYSDVVGDYFAPLQPVAGEDYSELEVSEDGGTLKVVTEDGLEIEFEY